MAALDAYAAPEEQEELGIFLPTPLDYKTTEYGPADPSRPLLPIPIGTAPGDHGDPNTWASGIVDVNIAGDGSFRHAVTGCFVKGGTTNGSNFNPNHKNGMNGSNQKRLNTFKANLMQAFHEIGYEEFVAWGKANKTKFYQLCGKMIPLDVKIEASHKVLHVHMALPPPNMDIDGMATVTNGTRTLPDGTELTTTFVAQPGELQVALAAEQPTELEAEFNPAPVTGGQRRHRPNNIAPDTAHTAHAPSPTYKDES